MTEWQPIETAPKNSDEVIVYSPEHGVGGAYQVSENCWCWANCEYVDSLPCYPTHWMPLPEPPK